MRWPLMLLALCAAQLVKAQMLLVEANADDPALLRFNPAFIARNGVKSVEGQEWLKRDGEPMRARDRFFGYRFGTTGRLDSSNDSFGNPGSGLDTASVLYTYNDTGRLSAELHNDRNGFYALRWAYDDQARPARRTNVRIENLGPDRYHFKPGAETVISDERYTYATINDTTWRKTFLNDRGRPYMEETFLRNQLGYPKAIESRNLITQRRGRISFSYNAMGRLAKRTEQPDLGDPRNTVWEWTYDEAGNPWTRDLSRNGVLVRHSEYLYAEGTLFLKAIITRDHDTGLIEVLRYETSR